MKRARPAHNERDGRQKGCDQDACSQRLLRGRVTECGAGTTEANQRRN